MTRKDRERLRTLAKRQAELAHSARNRALFEEWTRHGDLRADTRPMLRMELWTFEGDILPPLMQCEDAEARALETMLLHNTVNFELFEDDTLVPDHLAYRASTWMIPFALPVGREETGGLGHRFTPHLVDLEEDFHKLRPSEFGVDRQAAEQSRAQLEDLFGDILPIQPGGFSLVATPMQDIVHIMAMEDLYIAMHDSPALFVQMLDMLVSDYDRYFEMLEREGLLHSAARDQHLCQGSYCFTNELTEQPAAKRADMWLYMDSQETSGVSPAMFASLVFPAYARLMRRFGLVSYGCCEAISGIWTDCLSTLSNIRKVSISPWCDEAYMGDALRDRRAVYLRKPSPNLLGVGERLDEDAVRAHFAKTAACARGCKLEIAQRDVYRVGTWEKVRRYVALAREGLSDFR